MSSRKLFHREKIRKGKDLARRAPKKSPYETVLIVCEGEKSEVNYFEGLRIAYRLNIANILIVPSRKGSAPISVVKCAIEMGENTAGIDKVYCVCDRDEHSSFHEAVSKINNYKPKRSAKNRPIYKVIFSSPCFELWILLHFIYTTKAYFRTGNKSASENLISDLQEHFPDYAKNIKNLFNRIEKNTQKAIKHAEMLTKENQKTDSFNPAINVHELVGYLINLDLKI